MILLGQYLWTGKWGSQEGKEATAEPSPSREGTSLLRVISRKILLKQRFAFENQTENFLSKREDPIQKIPHSLIVGGFLRPCWVLQSIPHCPHLLDMGLQQQLPVALGAPALTRPRGGESSLDTNSVCWGIGHGPVMKINIILWLISVSVVFCLREISWML